MESKTRPFKNLKKWVRGIFDHIKYSLYLNLELFICYNFGHFKIKSLFFTRREIYNNHDNRIPIISSVNSRKYIVKKINY